jgi:hypothetical protein
MSSFHVDSRVSLKLEYDLATRLGEFILSSGSEDKQLLALGYKLVNIDNEEEIVNKYPYQKTWERKYPQYDQEKEIIRSAGRVLQQRGEIEGWKEDEEGPSNPPPIRVRKSYKNPI